MTCMVCHMVIRYQNYYRWLMTYRVYHDVFLNKNCVKRVFFYSLYWLVPLIFYYKCKGVLFKMTFFECDNPQLFLSLSRFHKIGTFIIKKSQKHIKSRHKKIVGKYFENYFQETFVLDYRCLLKISRFLSKT